MWASAASVLAVVELLSVSLAEGEAVFVSVVGPVSVVCVTEILFGSGETGVSIESSMSASASASAIS